MDEISIQRACKELISAMIQNGETGLIPQITNDEKLLEQLYHKYNL